MTGLSTTARSIDMMHRQPLTNISADRNWMQRFHLAAEDVIEGARLWRLAWALGLADIKLRYRGSMLGPFWLTISFAVMISAMGVLYADIFHTDIHEYLPYLTVSLLFWNYLSMLVSEGCTCFTQADSVIKGTRMPFTVHALRNVVRNTIIFAHNILVPLGLFIILERPVSFYALLTIPGLVLWLVDAFAISVLFGAFCARFRDVPQIIASVMQIAFFVTPVMWYSNILKSHSELYFVIGLNPFYYLLEVVRAPLLGTQLTAGTIGIALLVSAVIVLLSAVGFARTRGRIAYWV